jgi:hypothetical protein
MRPQDGPKMAQYVLVGVVYGGDFGFRDPEVAATIANRQIMINRRGRGDMGYSWMVRLVCLPVRSTTSI